MKKWVKVDRKCFILIMGMLFVCINALCQAPERVYIPPLDIPLNLSGNFGELRTNHFHAGVDFRTQGVVGKRVYAVADGHVSRIKIQAIGYGKALYITHPNGRTSVYAHLDTFRDDITTFIVEKQYQQQSFDVDLYLDSKTFIVKQGDFIALSGNTGGSSGPHLHFEIRDADQRPLNVLLHPFDIKDNIAPVFTSVYFYPLEGGRINQRDEKTRFGAVKKGNSYFLDAAGEVFVNGKFGIGVEVYDYLNGAPNRCGVYELKMMVNENLHYHFLMDRLSFDEMRYINAHVDYEEKIINRKNIHKLFVLPNNRLSNYKYVLSQGYLEVNDTLPYHIVVQAKDAHGNMSDLKITLRGRPASSALESSAITTGVKMLYNKPNRFEQNDFYVDIPSLALYDDIEFNFIRSSGPANAFSELFHIHIETVPLHRHITLALKPLQFPERHADKLCIARLNDKGQPEYYGGKWSNGFVTATTRDFGRYFVTLDTVPPVIRRVGFANNADVSGRKSIKFEITDNFSGVANYSAVIDGKWALFEYDKKSNTVEYFFFHARIEKNTWHELEITVSDNTGNQSRHKMRFFW